MRLIKSNADDLGRLTEFYKYVIDNTVHMKQYCGWIYGLHPSDDMIRSYIDDGNMYHSEDSGAITAAVALTPYQGPDYHEVSWDIVAADNEVYVVHILCVSPDIQQSGAGREIMNEAIRMAREAGMKAVRLDALNINLPAHRLYEGLGFKKTGELKMYAANLGWADFWMYELIL